MYLLAHFLNTSHIPPGYILLTPYLPPFCFLLISHLLPTEHHSPPRAPYLLLMCHLPPLHLPPTGSLLALDIHRTQHLFMCYLLSYMSLTHSDFLLTYLLPTFCPPPTLLLASLFFLSFVSPHPPSTLFSQSSSVVTCWHHRASAKARQGSVNAHLVLAKTHLGLARTTLGLDKVHVGSGKAHLVWANSWNW